MRIVFFSERADVHVLRFLNKLALTEHEIHFLPVYAGGNGAIPAGIHALSPLLEAVVPADDEPVLTKLRKVLADIDPDLIHAGPITTCGYLAARSSTFPLLAMSWGFDLLRCKLTPEDKTRNQYALSRASAAACDCETLKNEILSIAPALHNRVFVFPWGVDLQQFQPRASGALTRAHRRDSLQVISTRGFEPLYGFQTLIDGALQALKTAPSLRFVLAGDGSLRTWAQERIRAAGAESAFRFLGWISESQLASVFAESDIYVSTSTVDGSSISLLQALAAALPVIVTEIPANREWVTPGINGWLAPVGDPDALARALRDFAAAPESLLHEMSACNLALARQNANWDRNFEVLLQAYEYSARCSRVAGQDAQHRGAKQ